MKAVSDVSFDVARGETFGLVGESGCGKTTVGRLMVALERPNRRSISFEEADITHPAGRALRHRRRDLQLMFQDPYASLDPRMRVGPIIREPLEVQGIGSPDERGRRVAELLDEVGLSAEGARALPARVLRRPAPADRPRPGAHPRAEAGRGRRAGLGARRLDPGADPQPHEGPAGPHAA